LLHLLFLLISSRYVIRSKKSFDLTPGHNNDKTRFTLIEFNCSLYLCGIKFCEKICSIHFSNITVNYGQSRPTAVPRPAAGALPLDPTGGLMSPSSNPQQKFIKSSNVQARQKSAWLKMQNFIIVHFYRLLSKSLYDLAHLNKFEPVLLKTGYVALRPIKFMLLASRPVDIKVCVFFTLVS